MAPIALMRGSVGLVPALQTLQVKPQFGDGSDEIGKDALVRTPREFKARVSAVRRRRDNAPGVVLRSVVDDQQFEIAKALRRVVPSMPGLAK